MLKYGEITTDLESFVARTDLVNLPFLEIGDFLAYENTSEEFFFRAKSMKKFKFELRDEEGDAIVLIYVDFETHEVHVVH